MLVSAFLTCLVPLTATAAAEGGGCGAGGGRRQGGGGLFVGPRGMCSFLVGGTVPAAAPLPTQPTVAAVGASLCTSIVATVV